ncbi:GTP cyclohydrolase 1 type 2 like protein [Saliniradius amylolyticus]|uniref:GTP cyclohydrolase 1 type 2 homolog n=1 Tax=Saliniradius amylolyticus TaxID=2183582 RepID=A0A2S2E2G6_9ALTE|nr:Nif3-like dinuclear metal center hexameric protein [Saliniradius amylolyticus]AWL11838.1 GTP cyclohydrolase 1 type 2 like protein [Saliniradius amylolyticus]
MRAEVQRDALIQYLNDTLRVSQFKDYCPNGLQVEGKERIQKLVTGVTASQALVDKAIDLNADALLVHHGYFWKGEPQPVTGMKKRRLQALLAHDINLLAYHLPLDAHPEYGNNAQLAAMLEIEVTGTLEPENPCSVVMTGELSEPLTAAQLAERIEQRLQRKPLVEASDKIIKTLAWCTGGGQGFIDMAADSGVDAFITGEVSEPTIHTARERGIQFFAAGHHATERYGAKALGDHLAEEFGLDVAFVDIDSPA